MSILKRGYGQESLYDYHEGKIKKGLDIGLEDFDKHLRFKQGQFVMINGLDNVGKTLFIVWYFLCLSMKHNLKWCIWSGENEAWQIKRDLMSMYEGVKFNEIDIKRITVLMDYIDNWFLFVDNRNLYSHKEILKLFKSQEVNGCLIDPFTGMNHDRKINQFERNYQFCNDVREFCNKTGKTVYVNTHPQTEASRRVYANDHTLKGFVQPPKKSDTEGGQSFANRCDDFLTIHRMTNHPEMWMLTEVHVRKVKDKETGGDITFLDDPLRLDYNSGLGFTLGGHNPLKKLR